MSKRSAKPASFRSFQDACKALDNTLNSTTFYGPKCRATLYVDQISSSKNGKRTLLKKDKMSHHIPTSILLNPYLPHGGKGFVPMSGFDASFLC